MGRLSASVSPSQDPTAGAGSIGLALDYLEGLIELEVEPAPIRGHGVIHFPLAGILEFDLSPLGKAFAAKNILDPVKVPDKR
jgi:hypothetical protein